MKKIILSLAALFTIGVASAQSYIKQPDPTTYNVVEYKATKKAAPATEVKTETETTTTTPATTTKATAAKKQERARVDEFTSDVPQVANDPKAVIANDKKVATADKK
ncbi:hypothetical protein FMM05_07510 [Flavobacterium zepuense]|uniref:Uncharacterized protein n=1 Tax=Flavobacterium zepuense TaxID=2593302 RepID=A0A552V3U8_9FLAO|nr:hypothetical protein [Flavobacterium zepuense]TRW25146.1 hypothetical protein FMM05_07510 [Flavobacterium zepuense]